MTLGVDLDCFDCQSPGGSERVNRNNIDFNLIASLIFTVRKMRKLRETFQSEASLALSGAYGRWNNLNIWFFIQVFLQEDPDPVGRLKAINPEKMSEYVVSLIT